MGFWLILLLKVISFKKRYAYCWTYILLFITICSQGLEGWDSKGWKYKLENLNMKLNRRYQEKVSRIPRKYQSTIWKSDVMFVEK
jgi:hypothetical protein